VSDAMSAIPSHSRGTPIAAIAHVDSTRRGSARTRGLEPAWARNARCAWGVVIALVAGLSSGCAEELGPEQFETTRVEGIVTLRGKPVTGGWIEFIPVEGTTGNFRSAPIGKDGRFVVDRVPVGRNVIGLADPPIDRSLSRLFQSFSSPIQRTIPRGPRKPVAIDLFEEALIYQTAKTPAL
jgi:hypothetical protein